MNHSEQLLAEGQQIVALAERRQVTLRLTGGIAVYHYALDRAFAEREHNDIDLVGLQQQASAIATLFSSLSYRENITVAQATGGAQRQFFPWPPVWGAAAWSAHRSLLKDAPPDHIDVFLDAMQMDHTLKIRGRLNLESDAISAADLLLSKLQIVRLAEKDVHDLITLCKDIAVVASDHSGALNLHYLAKACATDWGLFVDVLANSEKVISLVDHYPLTEAAASRVQTTLKLAQQMILDEPKSLRFRLRARIGRRLPWHREVEETQAVPAIATVSVGQASNKPKGRNDAAA
ncbi:MAG: hypothetical protein ACLQUT_10965 [Thermoleophilia bacterium]